MTETILGNFPFRKKEYFDENYKVLLHLSPTDHRLNLCIWQLPDDLEPRWYRALRTYEHSSDMKIQLKCYRKSTESEVIVVYTGESIVEDRDFEGETWRQVPRPVHNLYVTWERYNEGRYENAYKFIARLLELERYETLNGFIEQDRPISTFSTPALKLGKFDYFDAVVEKYGRREYLLQMYLEESCFCAGGLRGNCKHEKEKEILFQISRRYPDELKTILRKLSPLAIRNLVRSRNYPYDTERYAVKIQSILESYKDPISFFLTLFSVEKLEQVWYSLSEEGFFQVIGAEYISVGSATKGCRS